MTRDDSRSVILARRARFVAAALAGSGMVVSVRAGAAGEEPTSDVPTDQTSPRVCLSDQIVEGRSPTSNDEPRTSLEVAAEPEPRPCLSIVEPETRLYFRGSAGPALLGMSVDDNLIDESGSGFGPSIDLALGVTLSESVAIGFGVTGFYAPSLRNDVLGSGTFWRIGTVVDYCPDPELGLHASVTFGPVYFGVEREGRDGAHGIGFGVGGFVGYDLTLSRNTAIGFGVGGTVGLGADMQDQRTGMNARAASLWIGFRSN